MNDLIWTVIVGFVSGVAGAIVVLAIADDGPDAPAQSAAPVEPVPEVITELTSEPAVSLPDAPETPAPSESAASDEPTAADDTAPTSETSRRDQRAEARSRREERMVERLREAGWSEVEIESLDAVRNAAALEMEQLMYEQMRTEVEENRDRYRMFMRPDTFRDALGDEKYEQYLEASGRPTAVTVRNLLTGSAADSAGIQEGDLIRRYGNQRIYDEADLFEALIAGEPGESVTIEVERDGSIFYVTVPRGPLGTSGFLRRWP